MSITDFSFKLTLLYLRSSQDVFDALGFEHIRPEFRNIGGEHTYKKIRGAQSDSDSESDFSEGHDFWWESDEEEEDANLG